MTKALKAMNEGGQADQAPDERPRQAGDQAEMKQDKCCAEKKPSRRWPKLCQGQDSVQVRLGRAIRRALIRPSDPRNRRHRRDVVRARSLRSMHVALRVTLAVLSATAPFAGALVAVGHAPPAHVEIAGQDVSVRPVLGQDTSRLLSGALVRPEHAHVDVLGKDIGVDVDADWNRLIPSDEQTRAYLTALWDDPTPQIGRIQDAARRHVLVWAGVGVRRRPGRGGRSLGRARLPPAPAGDYPPEEADVVRRHNRRLRWSLAVVGTAALVAVDVAAVDVWRHDDHHVVVSSPVFAGTTLEGTEVNGLAAEVLPFLSILRPRSTFYDTAAANLEAALADRPTLKRTGDEVVLVLAEDFEDVNGMARQVGLAADEVDASFLAITGDLTFAGLAVETYIIDTVDYYSDNRPVYFTPACTTPRSCWRRPRHGAGTSPTARRSRPTGSTC